MEINTAMNIDVNYVALLAAAVAGMVIGFLWYSPLLVGKPWMKLMGYSAGDMKKEQQKMGKWYALSFILSVISAYVLYHVMVMSIAYFDNPPVATGLMTAFFSWLGFVMPVQATGVIFSKENNSKGWNLFLINTGYQLVSLLAMGVVIGLLM